MTLSVVGLIGEAFMVVLLSAMLVTLRKLLHSLDAQRHVLTLLTATVTKLPVDTFEPPPVAHDPATGGHVHIPEWMLAARWEDQEETNRTLKERL